MPAQFIVKGPGKFSTAVYTDASVFERLGGEWRSACARMEHVSVFITPEYLGTAWKHFHKDNDQPWVMAVRDETGLVGLLPLVRSERNVNGLTGYELRHMGMWEGDRPGLIATIDADRVWATLIGALRKLRSHWQWLDLRELDEGAWPLRHPTQLMPLTRSVITQDTQAAFLALEGDWGKYFAGRSFKTRQNYLRCQRQLTRDYPDWAIEVVEGPEAIAAAFDRYVEIERRGWKSSASVGLWSDPKTMDFYRELLPMLARDRRASVWLLRVAGRDAAGAVRMANARVVYERLCAYDPAFARYSPGTLVGMEPLRGDFGTHLRESDALGMAKPLSERKAIAAWYDGMRQTHRLSVTNLASSLSIWLAVRLLYARLTRRAGSPQAADKANAARNGAVAAEPAPSGGGFSGAPAAATKAESE